MTTCLILIGLFIAYDALTDEWHKISKEVDDD